MAFAFFDAWQFITCLLLANGVPPKVYVPSGAANFALATTIGLATFYLVLYGSYSVSLRLLGFWPVSLCFGLSIRKFLLE